MKIRLIAALVVASFCTLAVVAQKSKKSDGSTAQKPNPEIQKMLKEVSAANIKAIDLKLVSFGSRNTLSEQDNPTRGIGAARDWIYSQFQQISKDCGGCLQVEKQAFTQPKAARVPEPTVLTNVYAVLKGTTDPDRVYVVSGHYDSMCTSPTDAKCDSPGANDDGSGTAVSIELARVMSKHKFDATIIFMCVPGEEQGLLGSTHYADEAAKAKMNIEAMLDNDIVGGVTSQKNSPYRNRVRVFSEGVPTSETPQEANLRRSVGGENDSISRQLARYVKEQADLYLKDMKGFGAWMIYRRDRYGRGGDHQPFLTNGYAAVRFTEADEDFTHQHQTVRTENGTFYGDTPEYVDFDYVANVARVNLIALASLASAPAKPHNVTVNARQSNDTEMKWDASTGADLLGYEIVWRDTTSPEWTNSVFVGNVTTYTVKGISKDNFFFGLRAVDKSGSKSQVVYPRAGR